MTAKEITEKREVSRYFLPKDGNVEWEKVYEFTPEQLQEYADALCREQIESCHLAWTKASRDQNVEAEAILNAPQPDES